jgi:hypothetical protein
MITTCSYNGKIHQSLSQVLKKYFVEQQKSMVLYKDIDPSTDDAIGIHDFKCLNHTKKSSMILSTLNSFHDSIFIIIKIESRLN